jgi:hypothetical protein
VEAKIPEVLNLKIENFTTVLTGATKNLPPPHKKWLASLPSASVLVFGGVFRTRGLYEIATAGGA